MSNVTIASRVSGRTTTTRIAAGVGALVVAAAVSACGAQDDAAENSSAATETTETSRVSSAETSTSSAETAMQGDGDIKLTGGTVRAKAASSEEGGSDMTSIFGVLHNTSDKELTITGFTTSLGADYDYQIHETVDGKMQEKAGGITLAPGTTDELAPGGDHLMVMGYDEQIPAGVTIDITLHTADGQDIVIPDVAARTMLSGDEDYAGGTDHAEHADHAEHSDHSDHAAHSEHSGHNH